MDYFKKNATVRFGIKNKTKEQKI